MITDRFSGVPDSVSSASTCRSIDRGIGYLSRGCEPVSRGDSDIITRGPAGTRPTRRSSQLDVERKRGPTRPRPEETDLPLTANADKRAQLMAECANLFRKLGYHGTSMSDIAELVKLNKGTLYYYFPSKADILHAIYLEAFARLDENVEQVPADLPPDEELTAVVKAILRTIASVPDVIAVYFQEHAWLETSLSSEQAVGIRSKEAEFTERIRKIIRSGVRANVFRRVNDELLSVQLLSMISSLYRWHLAESNASAELVADTIIGYLYDGILAPPR
jgi:AcrR family transcriptional regulator